jgi:hypothetical protein
MYNINKADNQANRKELNRILKIRQENMDANRAVQFEESVHDGDTEYRLELDKDEKPYDVQLGSINSDGEVIYNSYLGPGQYQRGAEPSLYTVDELEDYRKNTCRKPTRENPFMNPDITEFANGDDHVPAACNADDDDINDEMRINFNHDLFRDVDDLWERANSQRQFYTTPNTMIPNNQKEFAEWLYKIPKTCKEDGINCLRYEDLRFKR